MVDFRFLLIEWVLGTVLLAKGSPRGTPTIPKSYFDPWNGLGDRLEEVLSFSRGLCSSRLSRHKPAWPVSQTGLTGFALWAVEKGF
jgi:hypothetical protein